MKSRYLDQVQYNLWANQRCINHLSKLTIEQFEQDLGSSFPSIRKTLLHIWDAEQLWIKRLQGESLFYFPSTKFTGNRKDLETGFLATSADWITFIEQASEEFLSEDFPVAFRSMEGKEYAVPGWQITLHCMNHSSYHRGQVTSMARQLGLKRLQSLDYITYLRNKKTASGEAV